MEDKVGIVFTMALVNAIADSDVNKVCNLLKKFGEKFGKGTWEGGRNALHMPSQNAKTTEMLDVIFKET
jgi:hypothetical protein